MMKHFLIASCLLVLLAASTVFAASVTVLLPNGSTWRGQTDDHVMIEYNAGAVKSTIKGVLTRSGDLYLVIKKDDGSGEVPIFRSDIVGIQMIDGDTPPAVKPETPAKVGSDPAGEPVAAPNSSVPVEEIAEIDDKYGVYYLPLREMVGLEFRPEEIQKIVAEADEAGPGQTIILDIESGGGSVFEFIVLAEVIRDAKKRHQFVAWVGHAISAAAGTALCCNRIVWKSHGALGAITMHSGGNPVSDEMEEKWITMLKEILRESGHSPHWARPMVRNDSWISYVKDPVTGDCEYFGTPQGVRGEVILSSLGENVVLNKEEALECCLAYGLADNKEELAAVLDLPGWKDLGTGEKMSKDWLDTVSSCQEDMRRTRAKLALLGEYEPMIAIRKEIEIYKRWLRWWKRAPNAMGGAAPPPEQLERMIEELKLELRRMADANRN